MNEPYVAPDDLELEMGMYNASHTVRPMISIYDDDIADAQGARARWSPDKGWH